MVLKDRKIRNVTKMQLEVHRACKVILDYCIEFSCISALTNPLFTHIPLFCKILFP